MRALALLLVLAILAGCAGPCPDDACRARRFAAAMALQSYANQQQQMAVYNQQRAIAIMQQQPQQTTATCQYEPVTMVMRCK